MKYNRKMSSSVQVFILGIKPNFPHYANTYTATIDLEKATIDDLYQTVSFRTGIQMPLLQRQYKFIWNAEQLTSNTSLASQGIKKEDTIRLVWKAGLTDNTECPICREKISAIARCVLFCKQELKNGKVQMSYHPTSFHVECIKPLINAEGEIPCPLCRGKVSGDSIIIP